MAATQNSVLRFRVEGQSIIFFSPFWDQIVFLWGLYPCRKQQWNQYDEVWMSSLFPNSTPLQLQGWLRNWKSQLCNWFLKVLNRQFFLQNNWKKDTCSCCFLHRECSFITFEADFLFILKAQSSHPHSTFYPANVSSHDCYNYQKLLYLFTFYYLPALLPTTTRM